MFNQYEELKNILKKIEELEEAEKHIPIIKTKSTKIASEYVGKKFNMLTVLAKTDMKKKHGGILYKCQCECGKIVYYCSSELRKNTSCGCWRKSKGRIEKMKQTMKCFENTSIRVLENRKLNKNNISGYRGVSYSKSKKKWVAYIKFQYKYISLGTFATKEEAIEARKNGEEKYYKPIIDKYNEIIIK